MTNTGGGRFKICLIPDISCPLATTLIGFSTIRLSKSILSIKYVVSLSAIKRETRLFSSS